MTALRVVRVIRWDNSICQFVDEAHYEWRNDDGGEGALATQWYYTSWSGREQVVVSNPNPTTYTNYPVVITLPYVSGMQSNFADVRFTDSSGTTTVPYWIQSTNPGVSATIWINIPSLPSSGSVTLYMYYGNSGVTTTSSSVGMFSFNEDFESNNLSAYSGDTSLLTTGTGFVYSGNYGLMQVTLTARQPMACIAQARSCRPERHCSIINTSMHHTKMKHVHSLVFMQWRRTTASVSKSIRRAISRSQRM